MRTVTIKVNDDVHTLIGLTRAYDSHFNLSSTVSNYLQAVLGEGLKGKPGVLQQRIRAAEARVAKEQERVQKLRRELWAELQGKQKEHLTKKRKQKFQMETMKRGGALHEMAKK